MGLVGVIEWSGGSGGVVAWLDETGGGSSGVVGLVRGNSG